MARKAELQKAAMAAVRAGRPRQEVFASYQAQVKPERHLAFAIASVADPERRSQGAKLNNVLFGLLIFAAVTKALTALSFFSTSVGGGLAMLVLGSLVPVALAMGVRKYEGQVYPLLMVLAGVSALRSLMSVGEAGALALLEAVLLGAIGFLAFRVQRIVFPNLNWFAVRKDAQGQYQW